MQVQVAIAVRAPVDGAIDGVMMHITFEGVVASCAGLRYPLNAWKFELFLNDFSSTKHQFFHEGIIECDVFTVLKSIVVDLRYAINVRGRVVRSETPAPIL